MIFWRILVFPFAILYDAVTRLRNYGYDRGVRRSVTFDLPIISVGNLSAGGTGKTPHVEYLIRYFIPYKVATLSRGYGRKTKGYRHVSANDDAQTVGDEPLQLFQKFGNQVSVHVGEERVLAVPEILRRLPDVDVLLLDDAYQHRAIGRQLNILLTDYNRPFYSDYVLPAGYLRESRRGAQRADVIIVTKCPRSLAIEDQEQISGAVAHYARPDVPVFFSTIHYGELEHCFGPDQKPVTCVVVSGIAHSEQFLDTCKGIATVIKHFNFGDHHAFNEKEVEEIAALVNGQAQSKPVIITTEKDWARLNQPRFHHILKNITVFCLPIQVEFLQNETAFQTLLQQTIDHNA